MGRHERFSHPSEEGVRGYGETQAKAFEEAAKALESIMTDLSKIEKKETRKIKLENPDKEQLLVKWLNELLYLFDTEGLVFKEFKVDIKNGELTAEAKGEPYDQEKHGAGTVIKAATYNELKVQKENKEWIAQCIVDV